MILSEVFQSQRDRMESILPAVTHFGSYNGLHHHACSVYLSYHIILNLWFANLDNFWNKHVDAMTARLQRLTKGLDVTQLVRLPGPGPLWFYGHLSVARSTFGWYEASTQPPQIHLLVLTQKQQLPLWCLILATPNDWANTTPQRLPVLGDEDNRVCVITAGKPKLRPWMMHHSLISKDNCFAQ